MLWVIVTGFLVFELLQAEYHGEREMRKFIKPLASLGFVVMAIDAGGLDSAHGRFVVVGLVLSWVGDVFLLSKKADRFFIGLVAFLLAHIAYVVGFYVRGIATAEMMTALAVLAIPAVFVYRWLSGELGSFRIPVVAYMGIISLMLATAFAARDTIGGTGLLIGATLFYLSDVFVARDRFLKSEFINKGIGLPLYYVGQMLIAVCGSV